MPAAAGGPRGLPRRGAAAPPGHARGAPPLRRRALLGCRRRFHGGGCHGLPRDDARIGRQPVTRDGGLPIAAAACIALAGVLLAPGHPRAPTLPASAAVALAALGILLALPAALLDKDTLR